MRLESKYVEGKNWNYVKYFTPRNIMYQTMMLLDYTIQIVSKSN